MAKRTHDAAQVFLSLQTSGTDDATYELSMSCLWMEIVINTVVGFVEIVSDCSSSLH